MDTRGTQRNRDHQDPDQEEPLNTSVSALTSTIAAIVAEALQAQRADIDAMLRQQRAEILAQVAASPSIVPKTETIDPDRPPTPLSTISYSTPVRLHTFTGDDSVDPMSATTWFDEVSGVDIAGRRRNKVRASGDRRQSVNASPYSRDIIHLLFQACGLDTCSAFRYWKCRHDLQDEKTALSTFKALRRDLVSAETIEDFVVQAGRDILNEAVDVPGVLAERSVVQNLGDLIPKIPRRNALSVFKTDEGWTIRSSAHHPMEKLIQDPETNERLKRSVLRLRLVCPRDRPLLLYA